MPLFVPPYHRDYARDALFAMDGPSSAGEDDNVWTVHGRRFDMRPFLARHPGGPHALGLGRGRDCTHLVESYHPHSDAVWHVSLFLQRLPSGARRATPGRGAVPVRAAAASPRRLSSSFSCHGADNCLPACAACAADKPGT